MPTGILELKIGKPFGMPQDRLRLILQDVATGCNVARNRMVRAWRRWREDEPDWKPAPRRKRDGSPKQNKSGDAVAEHPAISQDVENALYGMGRDAAPSVAAKIIAHCRSEVVDRLKSRVPYNHEGKAKFVWEALLAYEVSDPTYRSLTFPLPRQDFSIAYEGRVTSGASPGIAARMAETGESSCVLRLPLLSRQSGFENTSPLVRLEVGKMSAGHRQLLRGLIAGEGGMKISDSKVTCKGGEWYFQLCYKVPPVAAACDAARKATLLVAPKDDKSGRPFVLVLPDGARLEIGSGLPFEAEYKRLLARRAATRYRSRAAENRGHGKQRFYERLRPYERAFTDMQGRFVKQLIADVVKVCVRNNCGTLLYREPTMPLRDCCWFASQDVPFNWSTFEPRLSWKCETKGLAYECEREPMADWKARSA